ncbi:MAG: DUF4355 domain-containing protein [Clostridia bacterium]|jgi:hypothetical protein|nr:DUF4355 domain-containing protein [Clostridia bacterium]
MKYGLFNNMRTIFFEADNGGGAGIGTGGDQKGEGESDENGEDQKTYTAEQVAVLIQSETDKRVQQALKTQQKKYEKEIDKQKSLSGLDAEARQKAEAQTQIEELQEQLNQYKLSNTKAEICKVLNNRGLDASLADFIVTSDDTDECLEKIETIDKIFKAMLKKEVDSRLKGSAQSPKASSLGLDGSVTKEQFGKMSLSERAELYSNNKTLYEQFAKK